MCAILFQFKNYNKTKQWKGNLKKEIKNNCKDVTCTFFF